MGHHSSDIFSLLLIPTVRKLQRYPFVQEKRKFRAQKQISNGPNVDGPKIVESDRLCTIPNFHVPTEIWQSPGIELRMRNKKSTARGNMADVG